MIFLLIPMGMHASQVAFLTKYCRPLACPMMNEAIRLWNCNCVYLSTLYKPPGCHLGGYRALRIYYLASKGMFELLQKNRGLR